MTPLFGKGGAVVVLGSPETSRPDNNLLHLVAFAGDRGGTTTIFHDDGKTEAYRGGEFASTEVVQSEWSGRFGSVTIKATRGSFLDQMPARRDIVLQVAHPSTQLRAIVNGEEWPTSRNGNLTTVEIPQASVRSEILVEFR